MLREVEFRNYTILVALGRVAGHVGCWQGATLGQPSGLCWPKESEQTMAVYKYDNALLKASLDEFDERLKPGQFAMHSGIYRCVGCKVEIVVSQRSALPPPDHHQHLVAQGPVQWQLTVAATG